MHSGISVILAAERVGSVFGFPVTNGLLMSWLLMALLIIAAFFIGRSLKLSPGRFQAALEWAFEGAFDYIAQTLGSREWARRFFPLLATVFIFILAGNELEFFPGIGSIGLTHGSLFVPLLRTPATDLNFTLALAIICFLVIEATGVAAIGALKYAGRYINLRSPLGFAVGLIELMSTLGRLISFSFRLFGNIFAGEVMVLVAGYFLPYLLPVPLEGFEMFIGVVQALVFSMLTLFFVKLAIAEPEMAH
ncbi:MAG TPA: FoF1 ATP synthase subunit a [Candidatus Paceibacterota bacterium]|nr:FoF1 ATP synthase subunit a [Candidatus Paceibacterota bacterium]